MPRPHCQKLSQVPALAKVSSLETLGGVEADQCGTHATCTGEIGSSECTKVGATQATPINVDIT